MNEYRLRHNGITYRMQASPGEIRKTVNRTVDWALLRKGEFGIHDVDDEDWAAIQKHSWLRSGLQNIETTTGPNRPATEAQRDYLAALGINAQSETNLTVERASQLIDAAKAGYLESVGGQRFPSNGPTTEIY